MNTGEVHSRGRAEDHRRRNTEAATLILSDPANPPVVHEVHRGVNLVVRVVLAVVMLRRV
jgi:hypothetical protein